MRNLNITQWIVVIILSLLTALEPLSIDLYLPGFIKISEALSVPVSSVQVSLTTFLGGFAIGQLIWGPLADKYGRKKPIIASLIIYILASFACIHVETIEQMWVLRFIQAIGGSGGIVIARAIVTDYFDKSQTLKIFALLSLIMGIAPIVAPICGNVILNLLGWKGLFETLAILGIILILLTIFVLPETHKTKTRFTITSYWQVLKVKQFLLYTVVAGLVNGGLMIYVANGPFLIMEKGGFSGNAFSVIFSFNAFGLMIASVITGISQKYITASKLVKIVVAGWTISSIALLAAMYMNANIILILIVLFSYIFMLGLLLPSTTERALIPFSNNSGTASSLFGAIQLGIAFICSVVSNYMDNGTIVNVGIGLGLCSLFGFIAILYPKTRSLILQKQNKI
jgi:DHA1 family bicyclomycin/chloramphenicol resistance-like MFS transporter